MKLFQTVVAAGTMIVPAAMMAASPAGALSVHVPFAFVMAGQEFAPGDYRVEQTDTGIISVQGEGKAAMAISIPGASLRINSPALEFTSKEAREHLVGVKMESGAVRLLPLLQEPERKVTVSQTR